MRTFVLGDLHGCYRGLKQVLERCKINKEEDRLIFLGDICDGWPDVYECVEELLTIPNRIDILGNHDEWFLRWILSGYHSDGWRQGGKATALSYCKRVPEENMHLNRAGGFMEFLLPQDIPFAHRRFFEQMQLYYVENGRCFVHGGFDRLLTMEQNEHNHEYMFYWDRDLWEKALCCKGLDRLKTADDFTEIFIGHTTCQRIDEMRPVCAGGVWNLDTGGGWNGKLTIMDLDTKEYWQSDVVTELYPEVPGRK